MTEAETWLLTSFIAFKSMGIGWPVIGSLAGEKLNAHSKFIAFSICKNKSVEQAPSKLELLERYVLTMELFASCIPGQIRYNVHV